MAHPYARLFEKTRIGSIEVKNRFAMAPMGPLGLATAEGGWNQRGIEYYTARARGGIGLIITGVCQVQARHESLPTGMIPHPNQAPGIFLRTSRELVERVHAFDSRIVLQVGAGFGRVIMPSLIKGGTVPAAPSPIPYLYDRSITCREMDKSEIRDVVNGFKVAGAVASKAGYDGIQVHAVHEGYLLDQFAIEMFNRRTDEYGGSLENRLRFAKEVVEAIHEGAGDNFPVQIRFSPKSMIKDWNSGAMPGEEFEEKGRDIEEGIEVARLLRSYGYDAFDLDVGSYDSWYWAHPPMYQEKGLYIPYSLQVKQAIPDLPIILAGRMDNPDLALRALDEGACEIISLGRPALADPEIVNKIFAQHPEEIRPCISCQEGCIGRISAYTGLRCAVNPEACRETDAVLLPVPKRRQKKVMIIGGGLAGMEAARVLAEREHIPVVYEKDMMGGVVNAGGAPSFKEDDHELIHWYEHQLKLLGVEVNQGVEVTADMVRDTDADHLIVASGSNPRHLNFGDAIASFEATDVLLDVEKAGRRVVVVGGGLTGCELALHLHEHGREVTIVEIAHDLLANNGPLCHANHDMLRALVTFKGVNVYTSARTQGTTPEGVKVLVDGEEILIPADTIVSAVGYTADQELWQAIQDSPLPKHIIGDARRVSNIMYAIWDAYEVASQL